MEVTVNATGVEHSDVHPPAARPFRLLTFEDETGSRVNVMLSAEGVAAVRDCVAKPLIVTADTMPAADDGDAPPIIRGQG